MVHHGGMADASHLPRPDDHLGYLLVRAGEVVARPWLSEMRASGLNPRQFSVLAILADRPTASQGELARAAMVTPQSMSEMLSRLELLGLVERSGGEPGMSSSVALTPRGQRSLTAAYPVVARLNTASVAALDPQEQEQLGALLRKVIAAHAE